MKFLKTLVAAGAMAVAALSTTAADAATRVVVGHGHGHGRVVVAKHVRAPIIHRAPIVLHGGWHASHNVYRPFAFYRGNPRLRACFLVTKRGFHGRRHALIGATMCYGKNGVRFVVPTSRHFVRFL